MKHFLFISLSAIFLLSLLFACTGKQINPNYRVEKTWAKDQERSSKVHVLKKNAQFANGKRVLEKGQKYVEMTEADIKEVDSLVEKYLYLSALSILIKIVTRCLFILGNTYVMRRIGKNSSL